MAFGTHLRSGKLGFLGLDLINRFRPVMPIEAKSRRHKEISGKNKNSKSNGKKDAQTDNLLWNSGEFQFKFLF